jgi:hypothetical protein
MLLVIFLLGLWAAGLSARPGAAAAGPAWEVETAYRSRLPGSAEFTARWRFEVVARQAAPDGEWWRVRVLSADGQFRTEAEFRLQPESGRMGAVRVREYFRDEWHEYPEQQPEPADVFLPSFGIIPLDFIARDFATAKREQKTPRRVIRDVRLAPGLVVRRQLDVAAAAAAAGVESAAPAAAGMAARPAWRTYQLHDPQSPGDGRTVTWDRELPWWVESRSAGQLSRLVAWYPQGVGHAE